LTDTVKKRQFALYQSKICDLGGELSSDVSKRRTIPETPKTGCWGIVPPAALFDFRHLNS